VLNLDNNQLAAWPEVQTLSQLPCLERLSLTGNGISDIVGQGSAQTGQGLARCCYRQL
jgi:Leucine-rich repeat (LRR) protein